MESWKRTLLVAAIAQTFSILGFSFVVPFLPLFIQQLGIHGVAHVTLWAAFLSGGTAVSMALTAPMWGVLADRYGRKIMVVRAMASAALIIALMSLVQNVFQLLALRVVQGAFTGTVSASQALVSSQTPRERMGFALGVMQMAIFLGDSTGPLVGGLLSQAFGFRPSFVVAGGLLFTGGVLVAVFVRDEAITPRAEQPRARFFAGMKDVLTAPALGAMIGAIFAVQFAITVVFPVLSQFVQYLQGPAGHAAAVTGLIFTGAGVAGAISSVIAGWFSDRVGYKSILVTAATVAAIFSVPQYFVTASWQLLALRVCMGFSLGAIMPSANALIAGLVPSERRGTAYGLMASANAVGFAAGPLTAAAVVAVGGIRPVFLTAAVLLACIALWVGFMVHVPSSDLWDEAGSPARRQPA